VAWYLVTPASKQEIAAFRRRCAKRAKFLLDENIPVGLADGIRRLGWNVKTPTELRAKGRSDEDLIALALRKDRILITCDRDFLNERRFPPHRNPGVIVLHGGGGDTRGLIDGLLAVLPLVGNHRELFRRSTVEVDTRGVFTVTDRDFDTSARTAKRYRYNRQGSLEEWRD
jgi:predicted nuclease of predicted toxin-antitoxin system